MQAICDCLKSAKRCSGTICLFPPGRKRLICFDDFTPQTDWDVSKRLPHNWNKGIEYPVLKHILNSAGIERLPVTRWIWSGWASGFTEWVQSGQKGLRNVNTLKTTILQIQEVPAGDSIGYSRRSYVKRDSRIAIIPIGYADGLDRHLDSGAGRVLINGKRCPTIGNICMDTCMIDVTGIEVNEGDTVIIFLEMNYPYRTIGNTWNNKL